MRNHGAEAEEQGGKGAGHGRRSGVLCVAVYNIWRAVGECVGAESFGRVGAFGVCSVCIDLECIDLSAGLW